MSVAPISSVPTVPPSTAPAASPSASPVVSSPESSSVVHELEAAVEFSATVAGKTFEANVAYSGGVYVANDPNVVGAEAVGTSREAAEDGFTTRIDCMG